MASPWLRLSVLLQKYRTPLLVTSCSGLFGLNLVQHLVPDQSFCKIYQAWFKGEPVELSERLQGLFQQVLSDVSVRSPEKFSAFASFGFHPVGAGLPLLPSGARIGIPANFNSREDENAGSSGSSPSSSPPGSSPSPSGSSPSPPGSSPSPSGSSPSPSGSSPSPPGSSPSPPGSSPSSDSGITDRTIFINGRAVDWSSSSGSALRRALVMSERAQRFALAREVARLDGCFPALTAAVAPLCVGGVWVYSVVIKQMFRLHSSPLIVRGAVNLLSLTLGAVSYFVLSDAAAQFADFSADRRAAAVAPGYARGGVEFYEKILDRNRTLRKLMGTKGEEMYSENGNLFPGNILQLRHTPYTVRRDTIRAMIQE